MQTGPSEIGAGQPAPFSFFWHAALVTCFIAPYCIMGSFWWKFIPATLLIVACRVGLNPRSWASDLGLAMSRRELFKSLVVLMLAGWFFRRFLFALAVEFGLESGASLVAPEWRLLPVAQALNEELVLRALLLGFVVRQLGTRWWVSPLCAAVFAAGHYVLYRFGTQQVTLEPTAFLTLFLFGMTANDLFLRFRHVGYSIALHLGWNLTRFGEQWMLHDRWLGEAQSFNLIEGNTRTVIAAAGLWVFVRLAMALPKRN